MTPTTIESIIVLAAALLRFASGLTKWKGDDKLAAEIEAVADATNAFRNSPVLKQEIDSQMLGHVWPSPPAPTGPAIPNP